MATINSKIIPSPKGKKRTKKCLACGTHHLRAGGRYCSKECRQHILWVLSLSKGLLRVFSTRYAAFSFNKGYVILDVLPIWSDEISRFIHERKSGRKPAEDLKALILQSGNDWYNIINNKNSRSYASLFLLKKNHTTMISPDSIKPATKLRPKFSKIEKDSMKCLQIKLEELLADGHVSKIKSAYKKLAKVHHPDVGGDAEEFKKLNAAHEQMILWAANPQFTSRKALAGCWSYDGATNKWSPPL